MGYSIMPLIGIKNELHSKALHIIPVKGLPIRTTWSLIRPAKKKHSPVSLAFLDYLKQEKHRIVAERFSWYEQY